MSADPRDQTVRTGPSYSLIHQNHTLAHSDTLPPPLLWKRGELPWAYLHLHKGPSGCFQLCTSRCTEHDRQMQFFPKQIIIIIIVKITIRHREFPLADHRGWDSGTQHTEGCRHRCSAILIVACVFISAFLLLVSLSPSSLPFCFSYFFSLWLYQAQFTWDY